MKASAAMGVAGTVTFATLAVMAALVLAAACASTACARYRPALVTLLGGAILAAAYVLGFTIAVERGAHRARLIDPAPAGVRECPAFMSMGRRGNRSEPCALRQTVDTSVRARVGSTGGALSTFTIDPAVMRDAPNARTVAAELVAESAGGVHTPRAGRALSRGVRAACCAANTTAHTDLSAMCPRADLLACDDLTR